VVNVPATRPVKDGLRGFLGTSRVEKALKDGGDKLLVLTRREAFDVLRRLASREDVGAWALSQVLLDAVAKSD